MKPPNCLFRSLPSLKIVGLHYPILNLIANFTFFVSSDHNLKRLTTIFLTSLILASAAGMTVAFHYCGQSLQDINVLGKAKSCCGGVEMPGGCCHDEKVEIKSDDYQLAQPITNAGFIPTLICEFAYPILDFTSQFEKVQTSHLFYQDNSPPPGGPDIVILTQSFLI